MAIKDFVRNGMKTLVLGELKQLQQTVIDVQVQLAAIEQISQTAGGNPYPTYDSAIAELGKKYDGVAPWGCFQTRTIVDVRAAFTIGNGVQAVVVDPVTKKKLDGKQYQKELDFINGFIDFNNLDEEFAQELAKEAELEGRVLLKLVPDTEKKQVGIRFISYNTNKYKVSTDPEDYAKYTQVDYKIQDKTITLTEGQFTYKKFAGRVDKVNDVMPKTATILRQIEDLDKCLKDLRTMNNLFASPTPHFNCEDQNSAKDLYKKLQEVNWKIGKLLVTTKAQFALVGADAAGAESLVKEMTNIVKVISGVTGIPVHFLGLPDLMSNRSTSTDMFEMIIASTNRERKTWVGTYEELFQAALQMSNEQFGTTFTLGVVSCDIPQITAEKLKALADVWLPLYTAGVVDLDYMLSMIPDADPARIKAAAQAEAQKQLDALKMQEKAAAAGQGQGQGGF